MAKEIEVKILDIDRVKTREMLKKSGAVAQSKLTKMRRYVFDIRPNDMSRWIRLRADGSATTLAVKVINHDGIDGTEEYETEVSDLGQTLAILEQLGFKPKSYQENYREAYLLNGASVSIDYWPKLEPYLEVEAKDQETVLSTLKLLELDQAPRTSVNTKKLYSEKQLDLDKIERLVFSEQEELRIKA